MKRLSLNFGILINHTRGTRTHVDSMKEEGQITGPRAEELARLVVRENAVAQYGLAKR